MNKRWISLLTLIASSIFTFACTSIRHVTGEKIGQTSPTKNKRLKVLSVTKTTGERIVFSKDYRGRILGSEIVGLGLVNVKVKIQEVERSNIKSIRDVSDNSKVLITKDGQTIEFQILEEEESKVILYKTSFEKKSVSIPLAEVKRLEFRKFSFGKTILFGACVYLLAYLAAIIVGLAVLASI